MNRTHKGRTITTSFLATALILVSFATSSFGILIPVTSGLTMWLRADQGVQVDGNGYVSQWNDITPNGNNAGDPSWGRQTVIAHPSGFGPRNQAYLAFDATDSMATPTVFSGSAARTVFVVMEVNGTQPIGSVYGLTGDNAGHTTGDAFQLQERVGAGYPYLSAFNADLGSGNSTPPSQITVAGATYDGTTASLFWQVGNGTPGSVSAAENYNTFAGPGFIGNYSNGNPFGLAGKIAEIAVFDRVLSPSEIAQVENYFEMQYVVPEPSVALLLVTGALLLWRRSRRG